MFSYHYTDKEMKEILNSFVVIVDTREKKNEHILEYFQKHNIPFKTRTMKTGDYSAMIPKNEELGIMRDIYINASIERKNSVDELVTTLKDRNRFENELIRSAEMPFVLLVEDEKGYGKILRGEYRSLYDRKAFLGSLKTFEARYNFTTVFIDRNTSGNYIYYHFLYRIRELLKDGRI